MVKIKICGITNLEDAEVAIESGCDALGFVFYKKSPRYITPQQAKDIIKQLPKRGIKVGVFVNSREETIKNIAKFCGLDILQFHGNESPKFCNKFKGYKIIKVFRIKDKIDLRRILKYKTFAYLFDTFVESQPGGTGRRFNWHLLRLSSGIKQPLFLSGGLNKSNVKRAIEIAQPDWVDVSSYVEIRPGRKNHKKIREFIKAAKG
jgi:phosphoribosylanthranilate isomerase